MAALLFSGASAFSKEEAEEKNTYDYDILVSEIRELKPPKVTENFIVWTADSSASSVGIAFDFENFSVIHPFMLRKTYGYEGEENGSWYFYIMEKPKKITRIAYKLIIDGLWTTDPLNENSVDDWENGIHLSMIDLPEEKNAITESVPQGWTKFVCKSDAGQKIRLAGSFTNWDSWIYEMNEISPGHYELSLPLPPGTYYYSYFCGLKSFIDPTNPVKAYSADGRTVSKITVN